MRLPQVSATVGIRSRLRRSPFILLEVLLAFALLACFAPMLMRLPIRYYQQEIESLVDEEMKRMADWTFTEVKAQIFQKKISWEALPAKGDKKQVHALGECVLEIPLLGNKRLMQAFYLVCKREKRGLKGETFRLYEMKVDLTDKKKKTYSYRFLVQKMPDTEKATDPNLP